MDFFKNIRSLASLNKYLWRYRKLLISGILFVIISNFFAVVPAQIVRRALDSQVKSIAAYKANGSVSAFGILKTDIGETILIYSAIIIAMALLKGLFMFFMRQTLIVMSRKIEYDQKNDLYHHFEKLSLAYYRRNNTGDLMARITEDVSRVRMYTGPSIMYLVNLATLFLLTVPIMLAVNVKLTIFSLLPMPVLAISIYFVNKITYNKSTGIQNQLSRITTFVQEVFSGVRVVKSFSAEKSVKEHFEDEVIAYKRESMGLVKVESWFFPAILLLIGLSTLLTLYVGGQEVISGRISPGVIPEFFIYIGQLSWPVASLGWTTSLIQRAAASQARINHLLDAKPEIVSEDGRKITIKGDVVFKNVNFTYPETGIQAMQNINIHLPAGKSLGIIGRTGSGKSTLANLLLRSYDTTSGSISIDGIDIKDIDLSSYRSQIGYVPQDDFLFSESIANNIMFGSRRDESLEPDVNAQKVNDLLLWSATTADVFKDIQAFPDGFETMIGERGITLSGGQKQRVGIARAIVNNPQFLILDDCFSAIDTNTEAQILQNLSELMRGKTSVIISHRVSTVKNASHIIVLDGGHIVEEGNHEQLMDKQGYYYMLYRKQLMEKELYDRQRAEA
jgi:ATP-binding cassette subfamily B protein